MAWLDGFIRRRISVSDERSMVARHTGVRLRCSVMKHNGTLLPLLCVAVVACDPADDEGLSVGVERESLELVVDAEVLEELSDDERGRLADAVAEEPQELDIDTQEAIEALLAEVETIDPEAPDAAVRLAGLDSEIAAATGWEDPTDRVESAPPTTQAANNSCLLATIYANVADSAAGLTETYARLSWQSGSGTILCYVDAIQLNSRAGIAKQSTSTVGDSWADRNQALADLATAKNYADDAVLYCGAVLWFGGGDANSVKAHEWAETTKSRLTTARNYAATCLPF